MKNILSILPVFMIFLFGITTGNSLKSQNTPYWLPPSFPQVETSGHSEYPDGYYFLNTFGIPPDRDSAWLMILDSTGMPVYYQMFHHIIDNFTVQKERGTLTYWDWPDTIYIEMDSSYNIINTYRAKNGYITDGHELRLMADGSYWIMAEDPQTVDMSQIIDGGNPQATVIGFVIQHVGSNDSVLFEWKSWDHFDILDADTNIVNLRGPVVDYVHGNALEIVDDSTILLSSRCLDEITKINTVTGDIVWRWGGKHNEFSCTNDTVPFLAQHHIRYHGNNIYSLFDNGIAGVREYSRALQYSMDENARTVTLLQNLQKDTPEFSRVMGSNQMLDNGNHLVGWSLNNSTNILSEFDANGNVVFDMKSKDTLGLISYRALKFPWHTNIFSFSVDTVDFETVESGKTETREIDITNNSDNMLVLNDYYVTDSAFRLLTPLPVSIAAGSSQTLELAFAPVTAGFHSAAFSLFNTTDTTRFGRQIRLTGTADSTMFVASNNFCPISVYPNPANTYIHIRYPAGFHVQTVKLISLNGKTLLTKRNVNQAKTLMDVSLLPDGTYLIIIQGNTGLLRSFVIIMHSR